MRKAISERKQIMKTFSVIFVVGLIISNRLVMGGNQLYQDSDKFSSIDVNEIPRILNMLSDNIQNNYKRVRTWEGKVESELDYIHEGKAAERIFKSSTNNIGETPRAIIKSVESIIEFSLDAEKENVFVHAYTNKPIKYNDLDTGRDLGAKGIPGDERAILTKEYYITSGADRMRDGIVTSRKAIKQNLKDCTTCQSQSVFDPRESFNAGQPVWKTIQHVLEQIKKNGEWKVNGHNLNIEKNKTGDVVKYRIVMPGKITEGNLVFTTMVFSGEKGFNITLFQVSDANDRIFQHATWDYEAVEGTYLPKETTHQNYMGKNGGLSYSKKMSFENSRVNHSIPADKFTYKNLGLKNGDRFVDKIENKEYRYEDANLVPDTNSGK